MLQGCDRSNHKTCVTMIQHAADHETAMAAVQWCSEKTGETDLVKTFEILYMPAMMNDLMGCQGAPPPSSGP